MSWNSSGGPGVSTQSEVLAMPTATSEKPASLIASDRVEGTPVFRPGGKRIGTIKRLMLDKRRGTVAYAVMGFGGFLGIGDDYYPLPWTLLTFDDEVGGYKVDISDQQLKGAPKFARNNWDFGDRVQETALFEYYGMPPYW
jgi:PRC-barrel domain